MSQSFRKLLPVAPVVAAIVFAMTSSPRRADADPATGDATEKNERCATRLYNAMIGEGATPEALASATPQASFDTLVKDPKFQEQFSRFINSQFNRAPGVTPAEDAAYYLSKLVLETGKPWSEMFVGKYDVAPIDPKKPNGEAHVVDDAEGLGYFRSRAWAVRYAGNELAGIRIVTAYRMMQNTIGLALTATTNSPDVDVSQNGRKSAACAGCHFTPWFALDNVATVLGTRSGTGDKTTFTPPSGGAQTILGGISVANDADLAKALVSDESFNVNACRLAYKYLYGRVENSCEGPTFDACVAAFKTDGQITSALSVVAKDPAFCE